MTTISLVQVTITFIIGLLTCPSVSTMFPLPCCHIIYSSCSDQIDLLIVKIRWCHLPALNSLVVFHFTYNNPHCSPCLQDICGLVTGSILSLMSQTHPSLYPSHMKFFLFLEGTWLNATSSLWTISFVCLKQNLSQIFT